MPAAKRISCGFVRARIPGSEGRVAGGTAPTLGVVGQLGGIGARPEQIGFVSDGDGALAAVATAAKLARTHREGDILPGDVIVATHICPDAPVRPHDPVPFMSSPVDIPTSNTHQLDPAMDAVLAVDTTKGNRICNHAGFAITPTVCQGWILRVSEDLLDIASWVTGKPPVVLPITMQDITPYGNGIYHLNSILVELIARRMSARGGRVLIVTGVGPQRVPASTIRLADRLGLPVVFTPLSTGPSGPELAAGLLALVHTPGIAIAQAVGSAARKLRSAGGALDRTLAVLESALGARCAAMLPDGTVAAGQPTAVAHRHLPRHPVTVAERAEDIAFAVSPVPGSGNAAALWLVAESSRGGLVWADTAATLLDMAAGYVAARNAADELTAERDARYLSGLLTELFETGDPVPGHIAERTVKAGWVLDGWHTAVYLTMPGVPPPLPSAARARLADALSGVLPPLIEYGDGWVTWTTMAHQPSSTEHQALIAGLRRAMESYHQASGVPAVVLGVSDPVSGAAALSSSVTQARQAATVAVSTGRDGAVQPAEGLGMLRLLLGWYGSAAFRGDATQLLRPLLEADGGQQLLETLEVYLDSGRSPSETAARLGLHRNTVAQREQELSVSLDDPDQRLAVHLASRALHLMI